MPEDGSHTFTLHAGAKSAFFVKCLISAKEPYSLITEAAAKIFDIDFVPNSSTANSVTLTPFFSCEGKQYAFSTTGYVTSRVLPHGAHMQLGKTFMSQYRLRIDSVHTLRFLQPEKNSVQPEENFSSVRRFHDTYVFSEQDIRERINFCFSQRQRLLKQAPES